jgi:acetoacetate decarboxylase
VSDLVVKGAWSGPASPELHPHCFAPVSQLPVLEVLSAIHMLTDLTLSDGEVVHDYLDPKKNLPTR